MAWDSLIFTPDPDMNEGEFNKLMSDCQEAQQRLDAFCLGKLSESELEDLLESFGIDPVALSQTFNENLRSMGFS